MHDAISTYGIAIVNGNTLLVQTTGRFILNAYFPLQFALMAIFFLYIGVKVIASKRPLLLPSKVFFLFMVFAFTPQIIMSFEIYFSTDGIGLLPLMSPAILLVFLVFSWFQMKGYMVIGVSDDSFRSALHYALIQYNVQFKEQLSLIRLEDVNADLQVSVQSWVGTAQLKLKPSKNKLLLSQLVSGINDYFLSNSVEPNNVTSIFYVVIGLFLLVFSGFYMS